MSAYAALLVRGRRGRLMRRSNVLHFSLVIPNVGTIDVLAPPIDAETVLCHRELLVSGRLCTKPTPHVLARSVVALDDRAEPIAVSSHPRERASATRHAVRSHHRRLASGRVVLVRAHERGIDLRKP